MKANTRHPSCYDAAVVADAVAVADDVVGVDDGDEMGGGGEGGMGFGHISHLKEGPMRQVQDRSRQPES